MRASTKAPPRMLAYTHIHTHTQEISVMESMAAKPSKTKPPATVLPGGYQVHVRQCASVNCSRLIHL